MKIAPFGVEQWMNTYEMDAAANLGETCVDSLTLEGLLDLTGRKEEILRELLALRLSYGDIPGSDELRDRVAGLHERQGRENVMITSGGSAANFLALYTLVEPGDEVVSVFPTYQQLTSIPESFGARVRLLPLRPEQGFLPDPEELDSLVTPRTKLICLNNPNNPTGALMERPLLERIVQIARKSGAWILCDEVYRFLVHDPETRIPSVADLYERGVVTGSLSKCFSLAGLRLGWAVGPVPFIEDLFSHRDYTTISCGRLDDRLGCLALEHRDAILGRNLALLRRCVAVLERWVDSEPRISMVKPRGGTTAFLHYDYDLDAATFCRRLYDRDRTLLVPGTCFDRDRWLRAGYAFAPDDLESGLGRVSAFLRQLESEGL